MEVCYSAAAEMELNKLKKREQANKRVSTTNFDKVSNGNVRFSRDHNDQQKWDSTLSLHKSEIQRNECTDINS